MTREEFESKLQDIDEGERYFYRSQKSIDAERALLDHDQAQREEIARLKSTITDLLMSSDIAWYEQNQGHDWREAYDAAKAALAKEGA